jgi:hypothetical protein
VYELSLDSVSRGNSGDAYLPVDLCIGVWDGKATVGELVKHPRINRDRMYVCILWNFSCIDKIVPVWVLGFVKLFTGFKQVVTDLHGSTSHKVSDHSWVPAGLHIYSNHP